jgi:hypothetical protein
MPMSYEELCINDVYRVDLLMEKRLMIEISSIERLAPVHFK